MHWHGMFDVCPLSPASKPDFPLLGLLAIEQLWTLSLALKPGRYRSLLFVPIFLFTSWSLACTRIRVGNFGTELGLAFILVYNFFSAVADIFLIEPQKVVKLKGKPTDRRRDESGPATSISALVTQYFAYPEDISSAPFLTRLKWAMDLRANPRGVGYSFEPTSVLPSKPPSTTTRASFILQRALTTFILYVLWDASKIMLHVYDSKRIWASQHSRGGLKGYDTWNLLAVGLGLAFYASTSVIHAFCSILAVGIGLSRPEDWPLLTGSMAEAYSLRQFWGKCWHQCLRRIFHIYADAFVHRLLGLLKSTKLSVYLKFAFVFFISGLIHFGADAFAIQSIRQSGALHFFLLQPVGIVIEDLVKVAWRYLFGSRQGNQLVLRIVGFAWVFVWLGYTTPIWGNALLDAGYTNDCSKGTPSILMGLWNGQWIWPENNRWVWRAHGPASNQTTAMM